MKAALLTVATGRYGAFLGPLYRSVREHLLRGHSLVAVLFSDGPPPDETGLPLVRVPIPHEPWPAPTLRRYHHFLRARSLLESFDLVLYTDADMRFCGPVGPEIAGRLVAVLHPGFWNAPRASFTYETRPESRAFVPAGRGRRYYAGGVQGGRPASFLAAAEAMAKAVDHDAARGITAIWHDESHWNRHLIDNPPDVELSPAYCYPELSGLPFERRILALDKDHATLRA